MRRIYKSPSEPDKGDETQPSSRLDGATELTARGGVFNGATRTHAVSLANGQEEAWGTVYRRGTRNREDELPRPSPHYHAPRLPSHYLVVPIARSSFITDSRTDIPPR
ncbi:hypothetical protein K0M31_016455 [Melipona bicolor]|uniref:Uncharacterized protein n=1 Tax=Melipona bicolor TaxID=60889 RepID=A0AA40G767_9HYME|nr:hypothetical protein K0M31_016455 [Melipona bicolor]